MLASRVRDLVRAGVTVSPDEVKAEFMRKNRQVNLEYMRFAEPRSRRRGGADRRRDRRYAAKNEAKLKEIYEQKKFVYEKVPPQRRSARSWSSCPTTPTTRPTRRRGTRRTRWRKS